MRPAKNTWILSIMLLLFSGSLFAQDKPIKPATPNASPEAKALLQLLYNLSGKYTLTGQHNFASAADRNSRFAADYSGKTPVIWSTDFGFAKAGDKDSHLRRADMVQEAIRQYQKGSIVALCWHAVPPTANEPVTFQPLPGADTLMLASVQGHLTDQQFRDILTPGTALHKQWEAQVDTIAFYLKQLQKAHVPVLWRPYHEMNGNWFWWGNRVGKCSTAALYRQIYDRLVNYHKINNLVWVWSVDRPSKPGMEFVNFYPGDKYLDILALDVYGSDFKQDYYDKLNALSQGKLLALAEVGSPPSPEILDAQPKWSYWMIWSGMVRNTSKKQYEALDNDPRVLGLDDSVYIKALNPIRESLGQPPLPVHKPADFTGEWILNEDKSTLGTFGSGNLPHKIIITQNGEQLSVQKSYIEEWQDNRVTNETITLNGKEVTSGDAKSPRLSTAGLSANADTAIINAKATMNYGGRSFQMISKEKWNLNNHGKTLIITQYSDSPFGKRSVIMVYDKQ